MQINQFVNDTLYMALERRLANLHGWNANFADGPDDALRCIVNGRYELAPKWTRDDAAAFQLLLKHTSGYYETDSTDGPCIVIGHRSIDATVIYLKDHGNDRAAALRYAAATAAVAAMEAAKEQTLGSESWRPAEISVDSLLSEDVIRKLDKLRSDFIRFEDGKSAYPWGVIRTQVPELITAYRKTKAYILRFSPDPNSGSLTEVLVAQLNRLSHYWAAYEMAPAGSSGAYMNAKEELVDTLNCFTHLEENIANEANSKAATSMSPGSGV